MHKQFSKIMLLLFVSSTLARFILNDYGSGGSAALLLAMLITGVLGIIFARPRKT